MNTRTLALVLGVALACSVAVNLFAATAVYTVLAGRDRIEMRSDGPDPGQRRPSTRDLLQALEPEIRGRVRQALRDAGAAARPDFQQARELRRQAVVAAAREPYDPAAVRSLLDQARAAEGRGRDRLEADALTLLGDLTPAERAAFARILDSRGGKAGGREPRGGREQ